MTLFSRLLIIAFIATVAPPATAQQSASEAIKQGNTNVVQLYREGRYEQAIALARRMLNEAEQTLKSDHPYTLKSINNLASLYATVARYEDAEPLYRRAMEYRERVLGEDHFDTLTSVHDLGNLYRLIGRYGEAETLARRALEGRKRILSEEDPATLASFNNLASVYEQQERYGEAEPLYLRAIEIALRVLGDEHPDTLSLMDNLAGLYSEIKHNEAAEPLFKHVLSARERIRGEEHPETLTTVNNLALLYQRLARYDEAEPLYRRALEARERILGPEHPQTITSVANLAFLYQRLQKYVDAEPLYRRALESSERLFGKANPRSIDVRGNLLAVQVSSNQPDKALRSLRELDQNLYAWLGSEVRNTRAASMQRHALKLSSDYQDAAFSFALAYPTNDSAEFATSLALRWKKRLAQEDAVLSSIERTSNDPAVADAILAVKNGRTALSNVAFDPATEAGEKVRLRESLEVAEASLRKQSAIYEQFKLISVADIDDVKDKLPPKSALIEFRFYNPFDFSNSNYGARRLLAAILRQDQAPVLVDLGSASAIEQAQRSMTNAKSRLATNTSFEAVARTTHKLLIHPLLSKLDGVQTLYISPDGVLHAIPFDALIGEDSQRLIDTYFVRMLQTGRDLVAKDPDVVAKGLVALGGIDFGPLPTAEIAKLKPKVQSAEVPRVADEVLRGVLATTRAQLNGWKPLKESEAEAHEIAKLYETFRPDEPPPIVRTKSEANEHLLKGLKSPPRVLHLATHGYYLRSGSVTGRPLLQSGVTLAGANGAINGTIDQRGENGILHAEEAQTLNLFGTELVVLSACDTGQGVEDYSEGLEGLPRAFYVAGARNVLVTLWPVGDRAARRFMEAFYFRWLSQDNSDPARALRQTKLEFITSGNPTNRNPDSWAPFVLFQK